MTDESLADKDVRDSGGPDGSDGPDGSVRAGDVVWRPGSDARATTRIGDYLGWLERERGHSFADYSALWRWSVDDLEGFWSSVWDYFEVGPRGSVVLADRGMPDVDWFPGTTLNYAEYLLRQVPDQAVAVIGRSQTRRPVTLTGAELRAAVSRCRAGLRRLGVGLGDRVAAYLPNIPEAYVVMLATASLGAVFSSCAPEFGVRSVVDRWSQVEPVVLVTIDGYRYGSKDIARTDEVAEIRAALPSVRSVIEIPYLQGDSGSTIPNSLSWQELLAEDEPLGFEPVGFGHPLYVLYSSGTTGLPKPIVHGHGGILLEHLKALALHMDLGPGDRFFWFSTTGWMMWNYLASGPAVGAAIVMYDGNPAHPDLGELWRVAEETGMTFFGTSAPYLMACRKAGLRPREAYDLSALRGLGSTGSPLPVEGFAWVYDAIADPERPLLLQSFSGGTDLCTGFVGGSPLLPVYAGELSCPCLGAAVAAYDPNGRSVVGRLGELVLERPMPSMPVGLWGDADGSRYRAAYFEDFPGVWRHGDWVTVTERGSCVITGRSDATLKRGGVRLGTAEFSTVVEGFEEIADSLVVHLEDADELLLFVALAPGARLDDDLRARIGAALRRALSPRHVPDEIVAVPAVPRTLSGKKLEVPVKRILTGTPVDEAASRGALADPSALDFFQAYASERAR